VYGLANLGCAQVSSISSAPSDARPTGKTLVQALGECSTAAGRQHKLVRQAVLAPGVDLRLSQPGQQFGRDARQVAGKIFEKRVFLCACGNGSGFPNQAPWRAHSTSTWTASRPARPCLRPGHRDRAVPAGRIKAVARLTGVGNGPSSNSSGGDTASPVLSVAVTSARTLPARAAAQRTMPSPLAHALRRRWHAEQVQLLDGQDGVWARCARDTLVVQIGQQQQVRAPAIIRVVGQDLDPRSMRPLPTALDSASSYASSVAGR